MRNVSEKYRPFPVVRDVDCLISFGVMDINAKKETTVITSNDTGVFSNIRDTVNGVTAPSGCWASLERDLWRLDGNYDILPAGENDSRSERLERRLILSDEASKQLYKVILERLYSYGIMTRRAVFIVFAMADLGESFTDARDHYAAWAEQAPEQIQAGLCYDTLSAGFDGTPEQILTDIVKEVKAIENGMSLTTGS